MPGIESLPEVNKTEFVDLTDLRLKEPILAMMRALYAEDEAESQVDQSRFAASIEFLVSHPSQGRIVVFREGGSPRGYALLVPYWSNEFGGILLYIDEIFVVAEARNGGIAHRFFGYLAEKRPYGAIALALEVGPSNGHARRLYESLGFRLRRNSTLTLRLEGSVQEVGGQSVPDRG
jgi:GNAT superfamily N-acetyltransferase